MSTASRYASDALCGVPIKPKINRKKRAGRSSERARQTAGLGPFVLEAVTDAGKKQSLLGLPGSRSRERTHRVRH